MIHGIGTSSFNSKHDQFAGKIKKVEMFLQQMKNLLKQTDESLAKMKKGGSTMNHQNKIWYSFVTRSWYRTTFKFLIIFPSDVFSF